MKSLDKPLFIPLKTEYYEAFENGSKTIEYRPYGPRWNDKTLWWGRPVVISKGYGKQNRMRGNILKWKIRAASKLNKNVRESVMDCYGTLDIVIAEIHISNLVPVAQLAEAQR